MTWKESVNKLLYSLTPIDETINGTICKKVP